MLNELQHLFGIMLRFSYSLLLERISGINNEEKGTFVPEFLSWLCLPSFVRGSQTLQGGDCAVQTGNHLN